MAIDLNDQSIPDEQLGTSLEGDLTGKPDEKAGEGEKENQDTVPYHQDPNVQLYIERQVAKRSGESNSALLERLDRLESSLKQPAQQTPTKIGDWTPASETDAQAAKAIVQQAKQEMLAELQQQQEAVQQQTQEEDQAFTDWLGELKVTSILKDDEEAKDFAKLIVRYKLDDRQAAVDLWQNLQEAKTQGAQEGEKVGIKKAQEAKIGSARTGAEPGTRARSYQERRAAEPNMNAILERELSRLGH